MKTERIGREILHKTPASFRYKKSVIASVEVKSFNGIICRPDADIKASAQSNDQFPLCTIGMSAAGFASRHSVSPEHTLNLKRHMRRCLKKSKITPFINDFG